MEKTASAIARLGEHAGTIRLLVGVKPVGSRKKDPYPGLCSVVLHTGPFAREPHSVWPNGQPVSADVLISVEQARELIDVLAGTGFFELADAYHSERTPGAAGRSPPPIGTKPYVGILPEEQHLAIRIAINTDDWHIYYKHEDAWSERAASRLTAMRDAAQGEAAKLLDELLAQIALHSEEAVSWGEAANGLQAAIAATSAAPRETPCAVVRLFLRNAGEEPARILRLGAARAYWPVFPVEVEVDGKLRDYRGPVLEPPPPPSIADFIDLAPGAVDSAEVGLPLVDWGVKEPSAAKVAFVYRELSSESLAAPFDGQARSWAQVKGIWTGEVRSGFVEVDAGD